MTARVHYDLATGRPRGLVTPSRLGWLLVDLSGFIRGGEAL